MRPERVDYWSKRAYFGLKRVDFWPKEADFGSKKAIFGPNRGNFRSERVDLGLIGLISGLKQPDLGLSGGGDVRMDRHKEIHPCVLQDISPLGQLPKKANQAFWQQQ